MQDDEGVKLPLAVLINTVMNPWATAGPYLGIISREVKAVIEKNIPKPDAHGFVMMGTNRKVIFLEHLPMFHMAEHRFQAILVVTLPEEDMQKYLEEQVRDFDATCAVRLIPPLMFANMYVQRQLGTPLHCAAAGYR